MLYDKFLKGAPTTEAERQRRRANPFSRSLVHEESCALAMRPQTASCKYDAVKGCGVIRGQSPPGYDAVGGREGAIVSIVREEKGILYVHTGSLVSTAGCALEGYLVYEAAEEMVRVFREDPLMTAVVELSDSKICLDCKGALKALREKTRNWVVESLEDEPALADATQCFGAGWRSPRFEVLWLVVAEMCFPSFVRMGGRSGTERGTRGYMDRALS